MVQQTAVYQTSDIKIFAEDRRLQHALSSDLQKSMTFEKLNRKAKPQN